MDVEIIKNETHWFEAKIDADKALLNWLVEKLNADKSVEFAAYKQDHPILERPQLVVRTKGKKAKDVFMKTLEEATEEVKEFAKTFSTSVKKK
ncbi:MAG TPA: RpoL/Rpb11 RNA polymerase subunit family protein [Candidatus Bilamarchaeaceae archaeon]|nr:RpoL/Rpb11 RNA polymerase subunit family protein [Candidatus Bilamarchaeaceae archaeon]